MYVERSSQHGVVAHERRSRALVCANACHLEGLGNSEEQHVATEDAAEWAALRAIASREVVHRLWPRRATQRGDSRLQKFTVRDLRFMYHANLSAVLSCGNKISC